MLEDKILQLKERSVNILGRHQAFQSAVLLPLITVNDELHILFEKRSEHLIQPGEICFPGGKIEKGESAATAAGRETSEELGIALDQIEILASLDVMVSPFNVIIYPFLGRIKETAIINPNPDEVEEVFTVPFSFFLNNKPLLSSWSLTVTMPDDYPYELIPKGKDYPYRSAKYPQHFFIWEDKVIWGLTARILNHFIELIQ